MKRRFLIPEVIQTSAMDCGPAALKALFGGFGVYLSYGRLREACQTDVDGTSIDTIEAIADQLGMPLSQAMLPPDLLLLTRTGCLPAIVVVTFPDGGAHFVVLWRVHGPWLQVMDPAAGRVWVPRSSFLKSLYIHEQAVTADAWGEWSRSGQFTAGIDERMRALRIPVRHWSDPKHQDAALRLAGTLKAAGKLRCGAEARALMIDCADNPQAIPAEFWTARPHPNDADRVIIRGAVLLSACQATLHAVDASLPPSLLRIRTEPEPRMWDAAWRILRECGWALPAVTMIAVCAAAFGTVLEALLFRGLFDMGRHLHSTAERLAAMTSVLLFLATLLALDWPASLSMCRLGRQLEVGLRARFLSKVPRLSDGYFQSRLISDMASRAHSLRLLRLLPDIAGHCLHLVASILITGMAIAWVYPGSAWLTSCAVLAACGVPAIFLPSMAERDLRFREISASLSSLYRDVLLGSRAIKAHCAEKSMRSVQAGQLRHWASAGLHQQALFVRAEAVQMALTLALVIALVYRNADSGGSPAGLLLLIYWAVSIPALGQDLAAVARSLPAMRNTMLRFLELISSPEEPASADFASSKRGGVKIDIENASIVVGGHKVLEEVTLHVRPGEHIGIVGVSGAGKSSLVGCLLGWHAPASGCVRVDDALLDSGRLNRLRRESAWIDPQVHLFRATLYDNLRYGNSDAAAHSVEKSIDVADLEKILRRSPDGLQMSIGEGGSLVSGGEGQRIRAARAFGRSGVRLAILDEPARGLGRAQRRQLVAVARRRFRDATLLCITHDVSDTLNFDRVLVIEGGRIVEQGPPQALRDTAGSRYAQLLEEEGAVARDLWAHPKWRKLHLNAGTLSETLVERA